MAPNIITLPERKSTPCPSKSPDLNPIEHLWDDLDRRVRSRQSAPQTLQELQQALEQEWGSKYRNKLYITLKFGTLVVQTLKFIKMSKFITLKSIAVR
jgi:transposase